MADLETTAVLERAVAHVESLQNPDGFWEGEMDTGTALTSQYVLARRLTGLWPLPPHLRQGVIQGLRSTVLADGSWPTHREGEGQLFSTVLAYVALRLLGEAADDPLIAETRAWIRARPEAALGTPAWGKFWLTLLGLYEYEGIPPVLPEIFLGPRLLPLHPDRFFCHTRQISVVMSRLYGRKFQADLGELGQLLRSELYDRPYASIEFRAFRHHSPDSIVTPTALSRWAAWLLGLYERHPVAGLRQRALEHTLSRIREEALSSRGHGLAAMSALLGAVALADAGDLEAASAVVEAQQAWMWQDDRGLRVAGARSSSWDTAFALHALGEAAASVPVTSLEPARRWLRGAQARQDLPADQRTARDSILGGWCFSDGTHRWPVSDCTAEALSALLPTEPAPDLQAVEFMLARQNRDGGFGSYERRRGFDLMEKLNPSELYADCTVEKSYTECTASCIVALARFRQHHPHLRAASIDRAIARAVRRLRAKQRKDGSYEGFWGINFTYGTFFALEALAESGVPATDPAISRAAAWLISTQKPDGGWGEHHSSLHTRTYVEHPSSQAAMTAWATLALLRALPPHHPAIGKGIRCLIRLSNDGKGSGWPQQSQSGGSFRTGIIDYALYKDIFPTWAIARYCHRLDEVPIR